jgi:pseudaminic acid cytidylyltransferase
MIAWSISAALESGLFDRVMTSTDDEEIADIARAAGAEVPFLRPAELSDDHTGTGPVIAHAIAWQNAHGEQAEEVCCIYATAPFIEIGDLCLGLNVLRDSGADFAFSVTSFAAPIQRALRIREDHRVEMFNPDQFLTRSQDLEEAWHDAAQFYWGHAAAWLEGKPLFGPHAAPVTLPRHRVQDIDTLEDWERAERLLEEQRLP